MSRRLKGVLLLQIKGRVSGLLFAAAERMYIVYIRHEICYNNTVAGPNGR